MSSPKRKHLKPGEKVVLSLTLPQVDLIVEHTSIGEDLLATLRAAKVRDDVVAARCTLDELDELAGYVAAEANNTKGQETVKETRCHIRGNRESRAVLLR